MSQRGVGDDHMPLPEEVAQRIMARAIELDSMNASGTTAAKLREVALEAGVSVEAFDQALLERLRYSSHQAPSVSTTGRASPEPEAVFVRLWKGVLLNLAVLAAWWLSAAVVLVFLRESIGLNGQMDVALVTIAILLGLELSFRMRARVVTLILAVVAAAELAMHAYTAVFQEARVDPWQMMLAALLGIGFGLLMSRRFGRRSSSSPQSVAGLSGASPAIASERERKPLWPFFRIRLGGPWIEGLLGVRGRGWRERTAT